jgi:hypothetical protein
MEELQIGEGNEREERVGRWWDKGCVQAIKF